MTKIHHTNMRRYLALLLVAVACLSRPAAAFSPTIRPPPLTSHTPRASLSRRVPAPSPVSAPSSPSSCTSLLMSPSSAASSSSSFRAEQPRPLVTGRNFDLVTNSAEDEKIFYDVFHPEGEDDGRPAVLYLPNLVRGKNNVKASSLQNRCKRSKLTFLCADYHGVGRSNPEKIYNANLTRWTDDAVKLMDHVQRQLSSSSSVGVAGGFGQNSSPPRRKKYVLIGSGTGGWLAFLIARRRPDLVAGIVGLSADPDFTEDLIWPTLSQADKDEIMTSPKGYKMLNWGSAVYPISKSLVEDAKDNLVLRGGRSSLRVTCPVRLLHGLSDEEVPASTATALADAILGTDVTVTLLKGAKHMMDTEQDFDRMWAAVEEVLDTAQEFDLRSPASG